MEISAINVRQLNLYVKSVLEGDPVLNSLAVCGEIVNFKRHYASGHSYFALKDESATVRCVMFKGSSLNIRFVPEDGMKVVCMGRVSLYERDGQYQFYVEYMAPLGEGELAADFEKIKLRLENDGLLDPARKRKIPSFPKKIGVLTSSSGAAVHDITSVLERRYPLCEVLCVPVNVQGANAAKDMVNALIKIYSMKDIDVIIIGRGGGSSYDLWAFNDEELARTVAQSPVPVISAVGHESDYSICDLVADVRAATPSVAAELAVPDQNKLIQEIKGLKRLMHQQLSRKIDLYSLELEHIKNMNFNRESVKTIVESREQQLDSITDMLLSGVAVSLENKNRKLSETLLKLDTLSPLKVLARGYSVTENEKGLIQSSNDVNVGENVKITLKHGSINCRVISKEEK